MLESIKPAEAKKALTALLHKAAYTHRPIVFESRGKPIAAVISMELLEFLTEALNKQEDREDWETMQAALKDPQNAQRVPWRSAEHVLNLQRRSPAERTQGTRRAAKPRPKRRARRD